MAIPGQPFQVESRHIQIEAMSSHTRSTWLIALRCPGSFQFHFTDRLLEREELIHSLRCGKTGFEIAHLLAQHPSRPLIYPLAGLGGILFETRHRSGYQGIIIPCHRTLALGAILLEQNDEWAVRRARYMTLETIAALSDDPIVNLPAVAA